MLKTFREFFHGLSSILILRITLAGFPTATELAGIFSVTTLPAPIIEFLPTVTPALITACPPIHTPSSMLMGAAER